MYVYNNYYATCNGIIMFSAICRFAQFRSCATEHPTLYSRGCIEEKNTHLALILVQLLPSLESRPSLSLACRKMGIDNTEINRGRERSGIVSSKSV